MTLAGTLRGASADSSGRVEDALREGLTDAGWRKAGEVGENLFALAHILRTEARLRRAVTDPSVPGEVKASLVRSLFEGKVDAISVEALASGVAQRWTVSWDLADVLERLAVDTTVRSADDPGRVAGELFVVMRAVADEGDLRAALGDPARSSEDKQALLESLLKGRALAATSRLVAQSVTGSHRTVALALEAYQRIAASVDGERVATVRTARALTESEQERLSAALSRQYDRAVHLNVVVEPDLIGGLRVEIGHDVIDGSVASRLDEARRRLAG